MDLVNICPIFPGDLIDPKEFEKVSKEVLSTFEWFVKEAVNEVTWTMEEWVLFQDEYGSSVISMLFIWGAKLYRKAVFLFYLHA